MRGWLSTKQVLHRWRKKHIKSWQLLLALVFFMGMSIVSLRHNNLQMIDLRNQVLQADSKNGDVSGAIEKLNTFIFHHMNTQIVRPIELVNTYNRAAQVVITNSSQKSGVDIYAQATAACEQRGIPLTSVAQCAAEYALAHNPGVGPQEIKLPDKSRFVYTFATPLWTPDIAGFSVLFSLILSLWLIARFFEYVVVRLTIRNRLRNGF